MEQANASQTSKRLQVHAFANSNHKDNLLHKFLIAAPLPVLHESRFCKQFVKSKTSAPSRSARTDFMAVLPYELLETNLFRLSFELPLQWNIPCNRIDEHTEARSEGTSAKR